MSVTINHQTNFVSATSGNLSFATNVVVSSVGNFGVGTSSPRDPGSTYKGIVLDGTASGFLDINANATRVLTIFGGTNDALLTNPTASGAIIFSTNNTEISRFDSAGRFLLGTSSSTGVTAAAFKRGVATNCFLEMSGGNGTIATDSFVVGQDSGKVGYSWNRANSALLFGTNNLERARIDSSGNFGIGVTPSAKLDVLGSTGILTRAAATQDGVELIGRAGGTLSYKVSLTPTTLSASRTLTLPDNSGTVLTTGATVAVSNGGTGQTSYTNGELLIGNTTGNTLTKATLTQGTGITITNGTGSITVANAGVTSITGTTNQVTASASTGSVTLSLPQSINTSASVQFGSFGVGTAASGTTGEIRATNNITAYYSDDRLKTRLGSIENALDKLCSLEGFYYEANELAQSLGYEVKREVGVSAQQVQSVLPEIVAPAPIDDRYLTVRYERALPLLIEAIKELRAEVQAIKAKLI